MASTDASTDDRTIGTEPAGATGRPGATADTTDTAGTSAEARPFGVVELPDRRPVLAVLTSPAEGHPSDHRPPKMAAIEAVADVRYAGPADLPDALDGADAFYAWDFLSSALAEAWPRADRLRWIHTASAGVDKVLLPGVRESGVTITNCRGVFDHSIAEYVLGLVLAFAKDLPQTLTQQRDRVWKHRETETLPGKEALVVGVGPIGREIARLLRAVGLNVRGVGRTPRSGDPDFGEVLASGDLADAVGTADFVVLAAPLTEQTRDLVDATVLAAMRPTARLINIGRGQLVVEPELVEALRQGRIAGAALDVFQVEPLPDDSPLWRMPNVIVSPHMSADFVGWLEALADVFADNVDRWLRGEPLRNVVDKNLGYVAS